MRLHSSGPILAAIFSFPFKNPQIPINHLLPIGVFSSQSVFRQFRCLWHHVAFSPCFTTRAEVLLRPQLSKITPFPAVPSAMLFSLRSLSVRAASPASLSWAWGSHSPGAPNHGKASTGATWEPGRFQPAWIMGTVPGLTTAFRNPHKLPRAVGQHTEKTAGLEQPGKVVWENTGKPQIWATALPALTRLPSLLFFFAEEETSSLQTSLLSGFSKVH